MSSQPASPLAEVRRHRERSSTDRSDLDRMLDATLVGVLSTVWDGEPWSVPMLFARDGDRLLLHGSTGAGLLTTAASGLPVTFCTAVVDDLVVAHSLFDSSANYRSAVVRGRLERLTAGDAERALLVLSDRFLPGRAAEVRPLRPKEVAATVVLALPIREGAWTAKERTGPPSPAPDDDLGGSSGPGRSAPWTGVLPVVTSYGRPVAAAGTDQPLPASVRALLGDAGEAARDV